MRAAVAIARPSTHTVDASLTAVEARVVNWVRWLYMSDSRRGRCASAERHYTAPAADGEGLAHRMDLLSINAVDAQLVQQAFVTLPPNMRRLLQLWYVHQRSERRIARAFGMPESSVMPALESTLAAIEARLAQIERPIKLLRRGAPLWAGVAQRSIPVV